MFNEEKDYVFLKKLNIFYIDRDASFQKILKENVKDFIIFTMCDSINTALKNFESARHDVILCDMSFPYEQINHFFKRFSNEIPIIAISSSNGAKVAYNAARLGARD